MSHSRQLRQHLWKEGHNALKNYEKEKWNSNKTQFLHSCLRETPQDHRTRKAFCSDVHLSKKLGMYTAAKLNKRKGEKKKPQTVLAKARIKILQRKETTSPPTKHRMPLTYEQTINLRTSFATRAHTQRTLLHRCASAGPGCFRFFIPEAPVQNISFWRLYTKCPSRCIPTTSPNLHSYAS